MTEDDNQACDDAELYALGGLNREDRERFETHLGLCEQCRGQLEQLAPIVRTLPWTVPDAAPPAGMKERVLSHVANAAADPSWRSQAAAAEDDGSSGPSKEEPAGTAAWAEVPTGTAIVQRRIVMFRRLAAVLGAAVVLLIALAAVLAAQAADLRDQTKRQAVSGGAAPSVAVGLKQSVSLSPPEGLVAKGQAMIIADSSGTHLLVQADHLPELSGSEAFQVWLLKGGAPVNAGTFLTNNGTGALMYTFEPDQYDQIAVTLEPDPNGDTPRGDIVLAAPLGSS